MNHGQPVVDAATGDAAPDRNDATASPLSADDAAAIPARRAVESTPAAAPVSKDVTATAPRQAAAPQQAQMPAEVDAEPAVVTQPAAAPPPPAAVPLPESFTSAVPPQREPAAASTAPAPDVPPSPQQATPKPTSPATRSFDSGEMPDLTARPAPPAERGVERSMARETPTPTATPEQAALQTPLAAAREVVGPATTAAAIDDGIDWNSCPIRQGVPPRLPAIDAAASAGGPVEITADTMVAELGREQAVFSGDVVLVQNGASLRAAEIALDRASGEVSASGGFLLTRPEIRFAGDSADYRLDTREAHVEHASYRVPAIRARGDAERAAFFGNGISRFDNITYTTCAPGDAAWMLSAETLELDHNEGLGSAGNATLRFQGVPLLYAPSFSFPIDNRRRSGVLVPTLGYSGNTGVDISVPYYVNLAPNYDLTLTPRAMSRRGLMLGGEFRFLTESTEGALAADLLPDDRQRGDTRGSASLYSHTQFDPRTEANLRLNYVSDTDYFEDLGGSLAVTSTTHVQRTGELLYHGDTWDLLGRAQFYQTIDDTLQLVDRPYARLPQLRVDVEHPDGIGGTTYHLAAEYVNFYRRDSVRGHRIDLAPALSLPLGDAWWYARPKVGGHFTTYSLTDQVAGLDDSPSHTTGLVSFDSGLYFDRAASYFGNAATQTLEPRLFYLYVPSSSQNDQPLFDTAELDFSFDNLFRENRFSGPDRIGDANQLTLALTTRINRDSDGLELLRASIGQILYFDGRRVNLPGVANDSETTSALVGEIGAALGGDWRSRAGLQWDPHDGSDGTIDQALAQLTYNDEHRHVFNAAYRLRDGFSNQTDLAFYWPVNEGFSVIGRHNYSLRDDRLLEALAGVEYGTCCWRVRTVLRQYTDGLGDDHNLAFLLQLELGGLGRLGSDIEGLLERGVYGYRRNDED